MNEIIDYTNKRLKMSLFGYNRTQVDEFFNELMIYCWNLDEENKELKNDLRNYNKETQIESLSNISNAKWEEKEYSLLLGRVLQDNVTDYKGNIVCEKGTIITSLLIENLISKGLYGELITAADPSKGVERIVR